MKTDTTGGFISGTEYLALGIGTEEIRSGTEHIQGTGDI